VVLAQQEYQYDLAGNIAGITAQAGAHQYVYDVLYQLTDATQPSLPQETFTYDPSGNRLSSGDGTNWEYDDANRLTRMGSVAFAYDKNGNLIRRTDGANVTTFEYDYENRLKRTVLPDGTQVSYLYDPSGRDFRNRFPGRDAELLLRHFRHPSAAGGIQCRGPAACGTQPIT
jgi:YD repeat-containing protein